MAVRTMANKVEKKCKINYVCLSNLIYSGAKISDSLTSSETITITENKL